jgi:hypothetical protein
MNEAAIKSAFKTAVGELDLPLLQLENLSIGRLDPTKSWSRITILPARNIQ